MEQQAALVLPKELTLQYEEAIRRNLTALMRSTGINQTQLVAKLEERGISFNQGNLSLFLAGKKHIQLSVVVHLCEIYGVSLAELVDENFGGAKQAAAQMPQLYSDDLMNSVPSLGEAFVTDPGKPEFQGYLQTYHVYLKPTASAVRGVQTGLLTLEANGSVCDAKLELHCDEVVDGQRVCKLYHGRAIISTAIDAVYILLTSAIEGELSVISFRHYHLPHQPLNCRVAAVLTNEAGEFRAPTMHRMFLSRVPIASDHLPLLVPHLYLNTGEIAVNSADIDTLRGESAQYRALLDQLTQFKPTETYYWPEEYVLGVSKFFLRDEEQPIFLTKLRGVSRAADLNKASRRADTMARNLLRALGYYKI